MQFPRWLREPLVHFLILGALLFLLFAARKEVSTTGNNIVVTHGVIQSLSTNFQRVWQRPPTQKELDSLIQDYIKDEIYYREAVSMGLDRDDAIIKRRMRQKLEFLTDSIANVKEPTENDLQKYLSKHPEKFRIEPRYTFSHVYLNPEKHTGQIKQDAEKLLAKLNQLGQIDDSSQFGDPFMLGYYFGQSSESNIARTFGEQFAKGLLTVEAKKWVGPIESGYGLHLVYISDRSEPRTPPLSEVRDEVKRDWLAENQKKSAEEYYENLRQRYSVTIEQPEQNQRDAAASETKP
jgi:hypothetical protein